MAKIDVPFIVLVMKMRELGSLHHMQPPNRKNVAGLVRICCCHRQRVGQKRPIIQHEVCHWAASEPHCPNAAPQWWLTAPAGGRQQSSLKAQNPTLAAGRVHAEYHQTRSRHVNGVSGSVVVALKVQVMRV